MARLPLVQIIFSQFFTIVELGGITKHLMTGPSGNSEFCFSSTSSEGLGETKLTVIKCLLLHFLWKIINSLLHTIYI